MSGKDSDILRKSSKSSKIVVLDDKILQLSQLTGATPAAEVPASACASATDSVIVDKDRISAAKVTVKDSDKDTCVNTSTWELPVQPIILRRRRKSRVQRQTSADSDNERKKSVKELTKKHTKKYSNVKSRIDTGSKFRRSPTYRDSQTELSDTSALEVSADDCTNAPTNVPSAVPRITAVTDIIDSPERARQSSSDSAPTLTKTKIQIRSITEEFQSAYARELNFTSPLPTSSVGKVADDEFTIDGSRLSTHKQLEVCSQPAVTDMDTISRASSGQPSEIPKVNVEVMDYGQLSGDEEDNPPKRFQSSVSPRPPTSSSPPPIQPSSEPATSQRDEFTVPRKTAKLATLKKVEVSPTALSNTYSTLATLPAEREIRAKALASKPRTSASATPSQSSRKPQLPPPLVLDGKPDNHRSFLAEIRPYFKKAFSIKYTLRDTIIYPTDRQDYNTFKEALANQLDQEFHTFTPKDQRKHAFVLLGLQGNPDCKEIQMELENEHGLTVYNVYPMRTQKAPLFLVVLSNQTTLKHLQNEVKVLMFTRVRWERRRNERLLTQCRRCQTWGHATGNCYRSPRCVKCGENHFSRECKKPLSEPPKCANCRGAHTACNLDCPVYINRVETLQSAQVKPAEKPKTQYVEAPLPTTNPWKKRTAQQTVAAATTAPTSSAAPASQPRATVPTSRPSAQPTGASYSDFQQLTNQINKLNSMIDLVQATKAITVLISMLEGVADPMQAISVVQVFVQTELPKFHILPSSS